jgi:SET and MYND domain-containing protein
MDHADNTLSKQKRHEALRLYHFECQCKRCKEDLDVYQVCQMSSTIPLNIFSLQPDLAPYTNPPIDRNALRSTPAPKQYLEAKMYAVEPLPSTIHDLVVRYSTREQNYAYALTLACFLATRCHPYSHVAPFSPWRVKGLMMIAQLLSQTAPLSAMGELGKTCPDRALTDILARMDQVSMCEAVLRLVVHYGPAAHSDDWEVLRNARELMDDIQQLQGRDRESAAIGAWAASPATPHPFIDEVVFGPIKELAEYGLGLIQREIKGDNRLVVLNTPAPWRQLVYTA